MGEQSVDGGSAWGDPGSDDRSAFGAGRLRLLAQNLSKVCRGWQLGASGKESLDVDTHRQRSKLGSGFYSLDDAGEAHVGGEGRDCFDDLAAGLVVHRRPRGRLDIARYLTN